jgi:hypothetical protein
VDRYLVSAGHDLPQPALVTLHLFPNDEECSPRLGLLQQLQESFQLTVWPIIEGQCNSLVGVHPDNPWKETLRRPNLRRGVSSKNGRWH